MGLIKQEPLKKVKEIDQTITLTEDLIKEINEYCNIAGITRGIERNGEYKTTTEAKREYFIIKAIERVLADDKEELEKLKNQEEPAHDPGAAEGESSQVVKNVLGDELKEFVDTLVQE